MNLFYPAVLVMLAYYLRVFLYFRKMFPPRKNNLWYMLPVLTAVLGSYALTDVLHIRPTSIIFIMVPMLLGLKLLTSMCWVQALYGSWVCVLVAYSLRGMFSSLSAIAFPTLYDPALLNSQLYYALTILSLLTAIAFFEILRKTVAPDAALKRLLEYKAQLRMVVVYEFALLLVLLAINHGRYLQPSASWFVGTSFLVSLVTLAVLVFVLHFSIQACVMLEQEMRTRLLQEQFERQLRHYHSYQKYTESFRAFKHDYKFLMRSVKSLIRAGENEKAVQLLDSIHDTMQKKVLVHKRYSDNVILDALLQDLANLCEENGIRYTFTIHIPQNTGLTLLDAIRVFSNVTDNAVEANLKLPKNERYIKIESSKEAGWITLEVQNPYDGRLHWQNGRLQTSKGEKELHGLGLAAVREIIEGLGGLVVIQAEEEKRVFCIRLHIPVLAP